jgi:hypothetical protein
LRKLELLEESDNIGILLILQEDLKMLWTLWEQHRISNLDEDMRLVNFLREHSFSAAIRTKVETNFPDSIRTSRKRIKESELRIRSAVNKIFLSEANKQERLRFAFQHINNVNFWENVVFSDEQTFQSINHAVMDVFVFINQLVNDFLNKTLIKLSAVDVFLLMFGGGWVPVEREYVL